MKIQLKSSQKLSQSRQIKRFLPQYCCICGVQECSQSIDHQRLSIDYLRQLIQTAKLENRQLDLAKVQITSFFESLQASTLKLINQQKSKALQWANQFYFVHLDHNKVNVKLACEILQKNYTHFPTKGVSKLIKQMSLKSPYSSSKSIQINNSINENPLFQQVTETLHNFLSQCRVQKFIAQAKANLFQNKVIKHINQNNLPFLTPIKSISQISNPQESPTLESYRWKNVVITKRSKQVELSNKNITDADMIEQMPIISSFHNIKEFQIRNNRITDLTCRLIASSLPSLHTLDIRGNKIGDQGIIKIIQALPKLKSFMISECSATDQSGQQIAKGMPNLQMLWSQYTNFSDQCAIKIAQKEKLKVLSLAGNRLSQETIQKVKKIFNCKGYIML